MHSALGWSNETVIKCIFIHAEGRRLRGTTKERPAKKQFNEQKKHLSEGQFSNNRDGYLDVQARQNREATECWIPARLRDVKLRKLI